MKSVILASVFCILIAGCGGHTSHYNAKLCTKARNVADAALVMQSPKVFKLALAAEVKYCKHAQK